MKEIILVNKDNSKIYIETLKEDKEILNNKEFIADLLKAICPKIFHDYNREQIIRDSLCLSDKKSNKVDLYYLFTGSEKNTIDELTTRIVLPLQRLRYIPDYAILHIVIMSSKDIPSDQKIETVLGNFTYSIWDNYEKWFERLQYPYHRFRFFEKFINVFILTDTNQKDAFTIKYWKKDFIEDSYQNIEGPLIPDYNNFVIYLGNPKSKKNKGIYKKIFEILDKSKNNDK